MAQHGFPLTPNLLRRHAEDILKSKLGDGFPPNGIGKHWADCFITKQGDRLKKYFSKGLDAKHARAVNPAAHAAWFKLLGETLEKYNISQENIYGSDETGFLLRKLTSNIVIGPVNQKIVYEVGPENRENVTVLCTICADGTSLPPLVIFKGKHFFVRWGEDNPLNCL